MDITVLELPLLPLDTYTLKSGAVQAHNVLPYIERITRATNKHLNKKTYFRFLNYIDDPTVYCNVTMSRSKRSQK